MSLVKSARLWLCRRAVTSCDGRGPQPFAPQNAGIIEIDHLARRVELEFGESERQAAAA